MTPETEIPIHRGIPAFRATLRTNRVEEGIKAIDAQEYRRVMVNLLTYGQAEVPINRDSLNSTRKYNNDGSSIPKPYKFDSINVTMRTFERKGNMGLGKQLSEESQPVRTHEHRRFDFKKAAKELQAREFGRKPEKPPVMVVEV